MDYYFRLTVVEMFPRRPILFRGVGDVIVLATTVLLSILVGVDRSSASADETRLRCEDMTFVSLDAVGMSERPCWTVCPPVKSLPMHTRFCQRNCPEYFQDCVSIPNVGRSVVGGGQETAGLEGHVTMKVFIIVSVVLAVVIVIVAIVTVMAMKCCLNNVISKHCRCKQKQQLNLPESNSKDNYVNDEAVTYNDEAATLMIRATSPPSYVQQTDDVVKYKSCNLEKQPPNIDKSSSKATDGNTDSRQNVTTAAEVHSSDCNSNLIPQ